jgi:hypothetical protein
LTPLERVLRSASVSETIKRRLRAQFRSLDPLDLLSRMREAQRHVPQCSESGTMTAGAKMPDRVPLADFLVSPGTAWQDGEVRPTHRRKARIPHSWRSREDPFEHTWPTIKQWLEAEPGITAKKLHARLVAMAPAMYSSAQLRTLQRRVKAWRSNRAKELVTRILGDIAKQPENDNYPGVTSSCEATRAAIAIDNLQVKVELMAALIEVLTMAKEVEPGSIKDGYPALLGISERDGFDYYSEVNGFARLMDSAPQK